MTISTIEETEIPEHYGHITLIKGYKTADSTGQFQLLAAGHHPKCRITRTSVTILDGSAQVQAVIEDGDGNDAATGLNSGTTAFVNTEGTLVAGQVFERNEAVMLNVTAAGTGIHALFVVELETIH